MTVSDVFCGDYRVPGLVGSIAESLSLRMMRLRTEMTLLVTPCSKKQRPSVWQHQSVFTTSSPEMSAWCMGSSIVQWILRAWVYLKSRKHGHRLGFNRILASFTDLCLRRASFAVTAEVPPSPNKAAPLSPLQAFSGDSAWLSQKCVSRSPVSLMIETEWLKKTSIC